MAPESFGLPPSARTPVRDLRRRRNRALHEVKASTSAPITNVPAQDPWAATPEESTEDAEAPVEGLAIIAKAPPQAEDISTNTISAQLTAEANQAMHAKEDMDLPA